MHLKATLKLAGALCLHPSHLGSAWPIAEKRTASNTADSYDYVVVGGGTSGLAVAARLAEGKSSYHDYTNSNLGLSTAPPSLCR
jgi:hypothetical protein